MSESSAKRVAFLGPSGTHSEEALKFALAGHDAGDLRPTATISEAIGAAHRGEIDAAFVPIENSIEGSVTQTLDDVVHEAPDLRIVGEVTWKVHHCLVAREPLELATIGSVASHPQALGQCVTYIRENLAGAESVVTDSTASAVRAVHAGEADAAIASQLAAEIYGGVVIAENIEDDSRNITRFVWLARAQLDSGWLGTADTGVWKTSVIFAGFNDTSPGALVAILEEFASRGVNLTKIESRPERTQLGHYLFFADLAGRESDAPIADALVAIDSKVRVLRVLGSFPVAEANGA